MRAEDELATAAATGNRERVEALLRSGADVNGVNRFGRSAIQVMMMGSARVARLLLERGANPNVYDEHTRATPLHDAARGGFLDTVRVLVEFRADPNARDQWNFRPSELARQNGHGEVSEFLDSISV